ncbi:MAG: lactoylglutathione lyase [Gammaproteobacteria bacterium]|nr:lactoylglutathione lyase [Gammaproteobacteria bacterium]
MHGLTLHRQCIITLLNNYTKNTIRLLHTMLRVGDLDRSIKFYTEILGMTLLRQKDYPEGKFTLAFLGYGNEQENTVLELTHNWDTSSYDIGNAFGHLAIEVEDVYQATEQIRQQGGKILRDAGPMNAGSTIIAFVEDPDGYQIELLGA